MKIDKQTDSTTKLFNYDKSLFDREMTSSSHASHLEPPQESQNTQSIPNLKEVNQQIQTNYQSQRKNESPEKIQQELLLLKKKLMKAQQQAQEVEEEELSDPSYFRNKDSSSLEP